MAARKKPRTPPMGRPPLPAGKRRESLTARLRPDLDAALREYAACHDVSLSRALDHAVEALIAANTPNN